MNLQSHKNKKVRKGMVNVFWNFELTPLASFFSIKGTSEVNKLGFQQVNIFTFLHLHFLYHHLMVF